MSVDESNRISEAVRASINSAYQAGANPIRAVDAAMHEVDDSVTTDIAKCVGAFLGIYDILDTDDVELTLRCNLIGMRNTLHKILAENSQAAKQFAENYRNHSRRISEMKYLQSWRPRIVIDGTLQRQPYQEMLATIERERDTNPGSRAQDIREVTLQRLHNLETHWGSPEMLPQYDDMTDTREAVNTSAVNETNAKREELIKSLQPSELADLTLRRKSMSFRYDMLLSYDRGHDPLRIAREMLDAVITDENGRMDRIAEIWFGIRDILALRENLSPELKGNLVETADKLEKSLWEAHEFWRSVITAYNPRKKPRRRRFLSWRE